MKVLTVTNQKGGVGKTATVVNIALFSLKEHSQKVAVLDLDTQANASWSLGAYSRGLSASNILMNKESEIKVDFNDDLTLVSADAQLANLDSVSISTITDKLNSYIQHAKDSGVEILIIDTPPSLGKALTASLLVSDYVICPIELESYSLQGVAKLQNVISNIRRFNNKLSVLGLLPSKVDNRNRRQKKQLEEIKQKYPKLIIQTSISLRSSVSDALSSRTFLGEIKKESARKASKEFSGLTDYIFNSIAKRGK